MGAIGGLESNAVTRPSWFDAPPRLPAPVQPQGLPQGNGSFSGSVAGTAPQRDRDLQFAQMANDSYAASGQRPADAQQSITELEAAGWNRLEPAGDHMVDANGNTIAIDPSMLEDPTTGFRAAIYQNQDGQYVVAYAGTDPSELPDIGADVTQALGVETQQYNQAIALAKEAEVAFGDGNVAFTGHSLGGGLASAAALATDASAVTYNSAGLSNDTLSELGFNPNAARDQVADSGQVRRYVVNSDPLTLAQQDLPVIPILGLSPPNAVGHELRVAPMPGVTPVLGTHGGGGDGTSYVESVRSQTPYEPADLSRTDAGLALSTLENFGEFKLNQLGSVVDAGSRFYGEASNTVRDKAADISDVLSTDFANGRAVDGTLTVAGDVLEGQFNLLGDGASSLSHLAGESVENFTNFGGSLLRDLGDRTGLSAPADAVAGVLEGGGQWVSDSADTLGQGAEWAADQLGTGAEWAADRLGDGAQWATDTAVDGAQWAGGKVVEGAEWVGDRAVDVGNAAVDAAQWTGDRLSDAGDAIGSGLSAVGSALNPFD